LTHLPRTVSLVAERAVRLLREQDVPIPSVRLAREVLLINAADELTARRILDAAFDGDPRLVYSRRGWSLASEPAAGRAAPTAESDRVLISLRGSRSAPGQPFRVRSVSVLRLQGDDVVAACGGDASDGPGSHHLRRAILDTLRDAAVIVHDPPGSLAAFERWLDEPLEAPISLRRLAQARLGLRAGHELGELAARLGLVWRDSDDPLEQADALDACFKALRRPGESLDDLRSIAARASRPIDWSRFAFNREYLRSIPAVPGTYRFYDTEDRLLYVGKSRSLNRRVGSYFRDVTQRSPRVQELLDRLYRIEYEASGSELEAILREAEQIRRDAPRKNVQRRVHPRAGRGARLRSILILEPAESPAVLRAFLIHEGRLIARVPIGRRGGGLRTIERLLDDHFFFVPDGPTPATGPDVDVEVIVRWLAAHRDRAVAFDPTNLRSAREVTDRLRWFLAQGSPFDPDGTPIFPR
jgi:hypothetical protein